MADSLIRPLTMVKKLQNNIEILQKKIDKNNEVAAAKNKTYEAEIAILTGTLEQYKALQPELPLEQPKTDEAEQKSLLDAAEDSQREQSEENSEEDADEEEKKSNVDYSDSEEEETPVKKSSKRKR